MWQANRMAAMNSAFYRITIFVLFQFLFVVYGGKIQHNRYTEYDVGNHCRASNGLYYLLSSSYVSSAVKLKIPRQLSSLDSINCRLTIHTFNSSLGTVLNFVNFNAEQNTGRNSAADQSPGNFMDFFDFDLGQNTGRNSTSNGSLGNVMDSVDLNSKESSDWNCTNFLEVTTYSFEKYNKTKDVCQYRHIKPLSFYSTKKTVLLFHFNQPSATVNSEFTIYATAYTQGCDSSGTLFKCDNDRCIWPGFKCDGVNNCGDNSDEDQCENSESVLDEYGYILEDNSMWTRHRTVFTGVFVPSLIICIFWILVRMFVYWRIVPTVRWVFPVLPATFTRRVDNSDGAPPYATLSEETVAGSAPIDRPPPYTNVVATPKANSQPA